MPGFDRTGPIGDGPFTGRGLGPCGRGMGFGRGFGRGMAFGQGFGRGFGWRYTEPVSLTKEEQKKMLEEELKQIESEKQEIEKRLNEMND